MGQADDKGVNTHLIRESAL